MDTRGRLKYYDTSWTNVHRLINDSGGRRSQTITCKPATAACSGHDLNATR